MRNNNHWVTTKYCHSSPKKVVIIAVDDVIIFILQMKKQKFGKIRQFFQSPQLEDEQIRNWKLMPTSSYNIRLLSTNNT